MRYSFVAYIDPGTGGLLLQFVLGGLAGIAAFVRLRWKAVRKAFSDPDEPREENLPA